ncbi:hypothetical protein JZX76_01785 [Haloarcula hispanica]|uniref:Uncharacterized protein n=1 Tax=Haloarcula hispanica TaxID=51589 RepID=A0A482TA74_HALHI|nr:hypothetical protein [Haloarcula hispanica]MCJ0618294.1 hypothetical protein [Haloarcula hispanica]RYJ08899.1 hypothetical protein ELS20_01810 [Haloarcula hispanica]
MSWRDRNGTRHLLSVGAIPAVSSRIARTAVLSFVVLAAGCFGGPSPESAAPSEAATTVASPTGTVEFHDGPKDPPDQPATLNESSAREFVYENQYRSVYNGLWQGEHTEMTLDCRIDNVTERSWGYDVVITCTGSSTTDPPAGSTATDGPISDYFTQSYRYSVSADALARETVENRDAVS